MHTLLSRSSAQARDGSVVQMPTLTTGCLGGQDDANCTQRPESHDQIADIKRTSTCGREGQDSLNVLAQPHWSHIDQHSWTAGPRSAPIRP